MKKFNTIFKYLFLTAFVVVMIFVIYTIINRTIQLNRFGRYTVAQTLGTERTARGGRTTVFEFTYKGKTYSSTKSYRKGTKVNGGYYYVKFSYKNPDYNTIYFDKKFYADISIVPDSGWTQIPIDPRFPDSVMQKFKNGSSMEEILNY